jgi:hypothetical protein
MSSFAGLRHARRLCTAQNSAAQRSAAQTVMASIIDTVDTVKCELS